MSVQTSPKKKESYKKPQLRTIELAAEEILSAGCKNGMGMNFGQPACGIVNNCVADGS